MPDSTPHSDIQIRSDEVQEIMSHIPHWMIRWGISLVFAILLLFLFLSWMIKYPDVITGTVQLTTEIPPVKLVVKNSGEINQLYFKDSAVVEKGDVLLTINNVLTANDKLKLEAFCHQVENALDSDAIENLLTQNSIRNTGNIQSDYASLIQSIFDYQKLIDKNNIVYQITNLKKQIHNNTLLRSVNYQQLADMKKQLSRAEEKYASDQVLYKQGVLSKMQFYEEEKKFVAMQNQVHGLKKTAIQHSITITDLEQVLNELEFSFEEQKVSQLQEIEKYLHLIKNSLVNWELNYQLISPMNGRLSYLFNINEYQFVNVGDKPFAIIPNNQEYLGLMVISSTGYGKVHKGQKVRIKLDNFPYHEYGQLDGVVDEISVIPKDNSYLIKTKLENGLISSYNKQITYSPNMSGTAEIITEDLRLLERIFNSFRKLFDN